jgi:hypothetical protein
MDRSGANYVAAATNAFIMYQIPSLRKKSIRPAFKTFSIVAAVIREVT